MKLLNLMSVLTTTALATQNVTLVTFDGAAGTTYKFVEMNDPVMGGKSTGTWSVNTTGKYGVFDGEVVDVPSLKAPGFIKSSGDGKFPDVSTALEGSLVLRVRSSTPDYAGFRVSFAAGTMSPSYSCAGGGQIPFSRGCFKNKFNIPVGTPMNAWVDVTIPFNSFSDLWSPATGEQVKTCSQDSSACPTSKSLKGIKRFEVWGEGALGKVHLEIQSISAVPRVPAVSRDFGRQFVSSPPTVYNSCKSSVQDDLLFGISGRTEATVPVKVDDGESLATAVCCDKRVEFFAEPQFLYQAPDILLYDHMDASGVTTFYDSSCGLPVFRTPVNRTFAEFQADTNEHGWPSFRTGEVFFDNVLTNKTSTFVTSVCGTHLGSYLPDEAGPRWCIDLSCIAGHKQY